MNQTTESTSSETKTWAEIHKSLFFGVFYLLTGISFLFISNNQAILCGCITILAAALRLIVWGINIKNKTNEIATKKDQ